jgi:hypothetical protein
MVVFAVDRSEARMVSNRSDRYRSLAAKLGQEPARALIDRLQVLALTQPDAFKETEMFLERGGILEVSSEPEPSEREPHSSAKPIQP